jgi:hypothetical protein
MSMPSKLGKKYDSRHPPRRKEAVFNDEQSWQNHLCADGGQICITMRPSMVPAFSLEKMPLMLSS